MGVLNRYTTCNANTVRRSVAGGQNNGPTDTPDLVGIGDFAYRQNPQKPSGAHCQTLVNFTFDQPVNTQGTPGNFQLVPIDSRNYENQVLDGNTEFVGQKNGVTTLTVPFPGIIKPENIARGFVDQDTIQTNGEGDSTLNPKEAADVSNGGNSQNPDLVSISKGENNQLNYNFDENIGEIGSSGSFKFYDSNGMEHNAKSATIMDNSSVVAVTFAPKLNVRTNAVGGSVRNGAVSGTDTGRSDDDTGQFDEVDLPKSVVGNNPPTDPDGDGKYEDVNGDGSFDVSDVQAAFANRNAISQRSDTSRFDFNGDGSFDVSDVQALFNEETNGGGSSTPEPVVGSNPPTDPDGDGKYEDVNGNGEFDVSDVQALFANRNAISQRDDASRFDFNGDGGFDVSDVQALFAQV